MTFTVIVFVIVYLGMILGDLPFLQIDRTGIALLGAIALVGGGVLTPEAAVQALHLPTLILLFAFMVVLLFAFMVVSAQLRLGGFYGWVTLWLAALPLQPPLLLGALILVVAALSAVFSNDIVCLAVAPVLIDACRRRRLQPIPYLLALACAANVGSAATLIGNPQNHLDRQPAKHVDRRDLGVVVWRLHPGGDRTGCIRFVGGLGNFSLANAGTLDGGRGRARISPFASARRSTDF